MSLNGLSGYTKTAHGEIRNADAAHLSPSQVLQGVLRRWLVAEEVP